MQTRWQNVKFIECVHCFYNTIWINNNKKFLLKIRQYRQNTEHSGNFTMKLFGNVVCKNVKFKSNFINISSVIDENSIEIADENIVLSLCIDLNVIIREDEPVETINIPKSSGIDAFSVLMFINNLVVFVYIKILLVN